MSSEKDGKSCPSKEKKADRGKIRPYGYTPDPDEKAPIIAVDVDGVLRDLVAGINTVLLREHPDLSPPKVVDKWDLRTVYPLGEAIYDFVLRKNLHLIYDAEAPPVPGAVEGFNRLVSMGYRLHLITTQSGETVDATFRWLARYGIRPHKLIITKRKENEIFDVLLEDSPKNCIRVKDAGKKVVCFDTPYNRDLSGSIPRVGCWEEFVEWVKKNLPY